MTSIFGSSDLMIMHFLFFLFLPYLNISPHDAAIDSVAAHLPTKWQLSVLKKELTISYPDSVYTCFHNSFNADVMDESRFDVVDSNGVPLEIKSSCSYGIVYATFRMEPRWSNEKLVSSNRKNDSLNNLIMVLPDKIGIERKYLFGMYSSSSAPKDIDEKKKQYENEKSVLENQIIILPEFETATYSLVRISYNGVSSQGSYTTTLWPVRTNDEMKIIMNELLPKYCPVRKK